MGFSGFSNTQRHRSLVSIDWWPISISVWAYQRCLGLLSLSVSLLGGLYGCSHNGLSCALHIVYWISISYISMFYAEEFLRTTALNCGLILLKAMYTGAIVISWWQNLEMLICFCVFCAGRVLNLVSTLQNCQFYKDIPFSTVFS